MATQAERKASPSQIQRAIVLLGKAGYDTVFIDSNFKRLGATMAERDWTVERWLTAKKSFELDMIIERLQNETSNEGRGKSTTLVC
jgi:hypothetical protein